MSGVDEVLLVFAEEAEDLLNVAEQALLGLDNLDQSPEQILDCVNDLFRTFHTIKGAAGLFGLDSIVDFTHVVESVLGCLREGSLTINEQMVSLFLSSRDHLDQLVQHELHSSGPLTEELKQTDAGLIEQLNVFLTRQDDQEQAENGSRSTVNRESPSQVAETHEAYVASENWHISLRFEVNTLRNGMDPYSFISYLKTIGEIHSILLIDDAIPQWSDFDPESCYLGFEIDLIAQTTKEEIEDVFEFVMDDCKISILPPHSHIDAYIKMIKALPEEDMRIGDMLVLCGALTPCERDNILSAQDNIIDKVTAGKSDQPVLPVGEIAVEQKVVEKAVVDAVVQKQQDIKEQKSGALQTVRVNAQKLEDLVNLVGELVIGTANVELNANHSQNADLTEGIENLSRLVEEVRDTALGLRMVPVGETFNRYKRVVREVSRELDKDIELRISGAETEMDKTLIEKISDPLMHLVRNAVDHGIEAPEQRVVAGKSARGVVSLDAFHDSGSIVIRISDDGAGLPKDKILKKAIEKNLVQEHQSLSDTEIYRLIFEPGFSTADTISNLSGRGVGMDVVRKNIEALRGQVEIDSEPGYGSSISIRLPLTLAIIEGFQVRVGDTQYIIPLDTVDECLELNDALRGEDKNASYINLRGEILPFMRLSDFFCEGESGKQSRRDNIIVVQFAGQRAGFVVDELLGEHQTVIKPLGSIFQNLRGISGATILGSGEVAMIVDVAQMFEKMTKTNLQQVSQSGVLH
jgi:two-component system, chemotaxis family, sensor kinase CheA